MQTLLLRVFILMFIAIGIAAAHSWNSNIKLHLEAQEFDWTALEDDGGPGKTAEDAGAVKTGDERAQDPEAPAKVPDDGRGASGSAAEASKEPKPIEKRDSVSSDPHITVEQAKRLFDRQFLPDGRQVIFVDARARAEFLKGHIENAISLPAGEFGAVLPSKATAWLPGSAVVIYCQGAECHDSHDVARRLQGANLDIAPIFILQAGYPAWEEAGHPTMTGPDVGWEL